MKKIYLFATLAACIFAVTTVKAQSLKDLFSKENVESVLNNATEGKGSAGFTGTWSYSGSAIGFKTDDLLKKAGGTVVAASIKKKMDEELVKLGITTGSPEFIFNENGVFSCILNKKTIRGTYSYDSNTSTTNFVFASFFNLDAATTLTPQKMILMFDADKLLLLLTVLSQQSNNATLTAIAEFAAQYDGMLVGLENKKK